MAAVDPVCLDFVERIVQWQSNLNKLTRLTLQLEQTEKLATFLTDLVKKLVKCRSAEHALESLPGVGQVLGRLCSLPAMLAQQEVYAPLMECVLWFYRLDAASPVEAKAKNWALVQLRSTMCHMNQQFPTLTLEELGFTQHDYNLALIQQVIRSIKCREAVEEKDRVRSIKHNVLPAARICLKLADLDGMTDILEECVVDLCQTDVRVDKKLQQEVEAFLQTVVDTQHNAYLAVCSLSLRSRCLQALWSHSLPALEQEVLCLVSTVAQHPARCRRWVKQIINSRPLACVCGEDPDVYHAVLCMLWRLLDDNPSSRVLHNVLAALHSTIQDRLKMEPSLCTFTMCKMFPASLHGFISLLKHKPNEMSLPVCEKHVEALHQSVGQLSTAAEYGSLGHALVCYVDWHHALVILLLLGTEQVSGSCCQLLVHKMGCHDSTDIPVLVECACSLRGLLTRTPLAASDVEAAVMSVSEHRESAAWALIAQCLMAFIVLAQQGTKLAGEILRLAGTHDPGNQLVGLLDTLDIVLRFRAWIPASHNKYKAVLSVINNIRTELNTTQEAGTLVKDIAQRVRTLRQEFDPA